MVHGDVKITESQAILRYICNTYAPEMLGKTVKDKAIVDMVFCHLIDIKVRATDLIYVSGDKPALAKMAIEKYEEVSKFLGEKMFFTGDDITFLDFFVWEQLELFEWVTEGEFFNKYPNFQAYHQRIMDLPKLKEYFASEKFMKRPYNNKTAKINN